LSPGGGPELDKPAANQACFASVAELAPEFLPAILSVHGWHGAGYRIRVTHRLHLFDTPESLAATVSAFFVEGYKAGGNLLIVAKPRHRAAILSSLQAAGCFAEGTKGRQRLVALDAAEILERIMRRGSIDRGLFETVVARLVGRLAAATGKLWIYGELVELLAEQEDFGGAVRLEEMWNELAAVCPFTLLCGYSSAHFTPSASRPALQDICSTHTQSAASPDDTLGRWLLTSASIA
jgi:hypothetical protein